MKPSFYLVFLVALLTLARQAQASCAADLTPEQASQHLQQGQTLSQKQLYWPAMQALHLAQGYLCTDSQQIGAQAARLAAPLGKAQGQQAENAGQWFSLTPDQPGAFQWYELGGHFADADRMLIQALKTTPQNRQLAELAISHFSGRELESFQANNKTRLAITGQYRMDPAHQAYANKLPVEQIGRLLESLPGTLPDAYLEDRLNLFRLQQEAGTDMQKVLSLQQQAGQLQARWPQDPLSKVKNHLSDAGAWHYLLRDPQQAQLQQDKIFQAKKDLAKRLSRYSQVPELLSEAMNLYRAMDDEPALNHILQQAEQLGDTALSANRPRLAADYFRLAGNWQKEEQASELADRQAQQQASQMQMPDISQYQQLMNNPDQIRALQQQALELQKKLQQGGQNQDAEQLMDELGL
ncbi:hypothetical protein [Bowmanella dokdonensis]|uniref:Uncharacterized protein n=1 Tax=Bowmanella dokdonensis TaxID=751969 RepID=A0A939IQW6_9ALTE|nr:hypothetical protein [Bowmanella dokdonensis]MBN7825494.1 hypothetical protein [Bowmanella dokdonensis]